MKLNYPLLALAIGAFGIGTTEFSPMGLLPVIAKGVDVSIPAAGMLISAYAVGVMVGAPLMTLLLSHRARRNALIFLMAIFTLGNVLSAISPDYTTLMLSRILTSLNHGAFFGLGSVVAASVVPKHKQASAVATMFMGLTIANIGGVPAATWLVKPSVGACHLWPLRVWASLLWSACSSPYPRVEPESARMFAANWRYLCAHRCCRRY